MLPRSHGARLDSGPPARGRLAEFTRRIGRLPPPAWIVFAGALAAVVYGVVSELRFVEFQTGTWDLGIYAQALWSTAHGRPFYEAADWETGGFGTLLQVHSAFLLYAVVPIYAAAPTATTLFSVQATVVAAASVPLYYYSLAVTSRRWLSLLPALLYLGGTATISSVLFDYHIEAFVPLTYFAFLWAFERERYAVAATFAGVGFATMEVLPALFTGVALCYAVPLVLGGINRWRSAAAGRPSGGSAPAHSVRRWACLALIAASVVAYLLLVELREVWLSGALHVGTFPTAAVSGGYIIGASPEALGLSLANLNVGLAGKLDYWIALLALCGFLPLLAPRSLFLSLPWAAFTLLSGDLNLTELGWQYGFLAGPPLFAACALALGPVSLDRVRHLFDWVRARWTHPQPPAGAPMRPIRIVAGGLAAGLISANLILSPLGGVLGGPQYGAAYRWSAAPAPGFDDVASLVAVVPAGAPILASDDLFPLVANDLNAYSLWWNIDPTLALPFDPGHPPPFVLLASNRLYAVPPWLGAELYNRSWYGVRGSVWTSPVGPVVLFQVDYTGGPQSFGPASSGSVDVVGGSLEPGPAAAWGPVPGSPEGYAVVAPPGSLGLLAQTPELFVPAGSYELEVDLRLLDSTSPPNASDTVVLANANAFAQSILLSSSAPAQNLSSTTFTTWSIPLDLPAISLDVIFRFYLADAAVGLALDGVKLVSLGGPA